MGKVIDLSSEHKHKGRRRAERTDDLKERLRQAREGEPSQAENADKLLKLFRRKPDSKR